MSDNLPVESKIRKVEFDLPEELAAALESLSKGKSLEDFIRSIAFSAAQKASKKTAEKIADIVPAPDERIRLFGFMPGLGVDNFTEMTRAEFQARIDAVNLGMAIRNEIAKGSDRATGIVGSAFVEDGLENLMKACWNSQVDVASLIGRVFDYPGTLASFSAKINVAYLSKIIGPVTFSDLNGIREVRNCFAHFMTMVEEKTRFEAVSFDHPEIIKICEKLQYSKSHGIGWDDVYFEHGTTARNTFIVTVLQLGQALHSAASFVSQGMPKDRLPQFVH